MTDLRDLQFIKHERQERALPNLEHAIVANSPTAAGDDLFIILPEFDNAATWGPAKWHPAGEDMPAAGDECLVAFSNRREPWVVAWWPGVEDIPGGGGGVTSFNVRTGAVVAVSGDYSVSQVTGAAPLASPVFSGDPQAPTPLTADNDTSVATTAFVKAQGYVTALTAPVTSVYARTGAIVATTGDYTVAQVTGAAPLASPAFTGTPTAPTAAVDTNTTQLATTAFVLGQAAAATPVMDGTAAVGVSTRFARGDHVHPTDTTRAPLASPAFTGVPTAPTAAPGTNTTQLATTAFVTAAVAAGGGGGVTSFNVRTGAVVPTAGDYTAAQVTNAADKAAGVSQVFTSNVAVTTAVTTIGAAAGGLLGQGIVSLSGPAGNAVLQTTVAGDVTDWRFVIANSGTLSWGTGAAARDTTLSRSSVGTLDLGTSVQRNTLRIFGSVAADSVLSARVTTDAFPRFQINADGTHSWGPGSAGTDSSFARLGVALLGTTDSHFTTGPLTNARATVGTYLEHGTGRVLVTAPLVSTTSTFACAVLADASWRWTIDASGIMGWSNGAGAADVGLFRSAVDAPGATAITLHSNQSIATSSVAGFKTISPINNFALQTYLLAADTTAAFQIFQQGALQWGPGGSTTQDIELARVVSSPSGTGSFIEFIKGDGFGYGTGCGGVVTQATSFATGVTLNKPSGKITLFTSAISAGLVSQFTVTNSVVGIDDTVVLSGDNTAGMVMSASVAAGSFVITWYAPAALISATRKIDFAVIKGAVA